MVRNLLDIIRSVNVNRRELTEQIIYFKTSNICRRVWLHQGYCCEGGQVLDNVLLLGCLFMGLLMLYYLFNFFLLLFLFGKVELDFLLLRRNWGKGGMKFEEFGFDLLHQFHMVVVELCFSSLEVAIIGQLSEIQILSGETFAINDALTEVLD
jgi:hypothetical protein